jgi:hypothetical protein
VTTFLQGAATLTHLAQAALLALAFAGLADLADGDNGWPP